MTEQFINRRQTLKYLGLLTATAAGREFLSAWLPPAPQSIAASGPDSMAGMHHGAPPDPQEGKLDALHFFKPDEFETVEILTEMIIPADDKPGARDAQVGSYIDFVLFSATEFKPELQRSWTDGLAWLDSASRKQFGKAFREVSPADREHLMTEMSLPERDLHAGKSHPGFSFYELVKGMTVEGFYTSRIGLVDVLDYQGLTYLAEFPGCTHPEHQK